MNGKQCRRYLEELLREGSLDLPKFYASFLAEQLLATFSHGNATSFYLNRHAILHGADVSYATAAASLRAILVFDFIVGQTEYISVEGTGQYHAARMPAPAGSGSRLPHRVLRQRPGACRWK